MMPCWHDGALDDVSPGDRPLVWSVDAGGDIAAGAVTGIAATSDDLADAARGRVETGWRLLRRRLTRALIAQLADVPAASVRLGRTAAGAPLVLAPGGWHVGLSGRGGNTLIGVARQPIAVDWEPLDDAPPLRDMLTPAELHVLDAVAEADRSLDWLRRWTIKEAHAKLIGEPLRIRPDAIETRLLDNVEATATFEGVSRCWTRRTATALETVALWA